MDSFCIYCGARFEESAKFCLECGATRATQNAVSIAVEGLPIKSGLPEGPGSATSAGPPASGKSGT